ncbi:hypothetical protein OIN60_00510 [Paenibacillus sp. P96]|uniref:BIG2 domain-containing protein n=1 Tax=Paenibacillus zeirhizosphaerae TaxID=2987519 RepID=A0ABT9FKL9_9BACL|nr:hypothetical protein [Paenibacillus sp. P96]MDP4095273.1 hypothetical protein [Paenibacillus sp. P96]
MLLGGWMRYLFKAFIFAVFLFFGVLQHEAQAQATADHRWAPTADTLKHYESTVFNGQQAYGLKTSDGGQLFLQNVGRSEDTDEVFWKVTKQNADGQTEWFTPLNSYFGPYSAALYENNDGTYTVAIRDFHIPSDRMAYVFYKLDGEGNVLWSAPVGWYSVHGIVQLQSGGFALYGSDGTNRSSVEVTLLGSDGSYRDTSLGLGVVSNISETPDRGLVVTVQDPWYTSYTVARIGSCGKKWSVDYPGTEEHGYSRIVDAAAGLADGGAYIFAEGKIFTVNASGTEVASRDFPYQVSRARLLEDGDVLILGRNGQQNLMKLNPQTGEPIWSYTVPDQIVDAAPAPGPGSYWLYTSGEPTIRYELQQGLKLSSVTDAVYAGETLQIEASVILEGGEERALDLTDGDVEFTSSNPNTAVISGEGVLTVLLGAPAGTIHITGDFYGLRDTIGIKIRREE